MRHELKIDQQCFYDIEAGRKTFEIRKDDRGYVIGDTLLLCQTLSTGVEMANGAALQYTGREVMVEVLYIMRGSCYGLLADYVVMSIRLVG